MTLQEFQAKFEGVLLSAPMLAAAIIDLVQDERATERERCAKIADSYGQNYHNTAHHIAFAIRGLSEKEV